MQPGDKIKMDGERQRYTVMACDKRFIIAIKPFNAQKTYLYTIIDLDKKVRGPCNLIFGLPSPVNTDEGAYLALQMLQNNDMAVSGRKCKSLIEDEINACSV